MEVKAVESKLVEDFHTYVSRVIDEKGVYPLPGMSKIGFEDKMEVAAITSPFLAMKWLWDQVAIKGAVECILGVDMTTMPNQGTEFADVLVCFHWAEGMDGKDWGNSFRIGVINYQNEPRIVRPYDWNNSHWIKVATGLILSERPKFRAKITRGG